MKLKWIVNTITIALLILVAFLGLAKHDSVMAAQDEGNKIEGLLLDRFSIEGSADFIVRFTEQADLSVAYAMDWKARGEFVYNTLLETANRSQANAIAILNSNGLKYQTLIGGNDLYVWSGTLAAANDLAALPEVSFIRATRTYYIDPITTTKAFGNFSWAGDFLAKNAQTTVGSSPNATTDWGITDTKADQAWLLGARGAGIKVANIDTGVQWNHPALVNSFACANGNDPACWADPSNICGGTACDNNGHGTHTMGTMVAQDDPSLPYIAGMAPDATWIACKGCETNSCSDYALTTCADWILAPGGNEANRPNVVNNSWGGGGGDAWYLSYVNAWRASGIFPAFSAGNAGPGCSTLGSPGDYQESFGSAAHDSGRNIASFSSRGPSAFGHEPYTKPNISAPGVNICSTVPTNGWNCGYSGTSMASPHTAGAVAQLWSCAPQLIGEIDQTFQALQDSTNAPPAGSCGAPPDGEGNYTFGYGYLDALNLVTLNCGIAEIGTLQGYVLDQYGSPVEGASVIAQPAVAGKGINATTDPTGFYTMDLVVGTYDVTASKINYESQVVYGVEILSGQVTTQDFEITFMGAWTQLSLGLNCPDWTRLDMEYYDGTGLAYILGGRSGTSTVGTIYSYNPSTNGCSNTGQTMPVPISNYTIVPLNDGSADLLCTFGGRDSAGNMILTAQCYNPVANTVTTKADLPSTFVGFLPGGAAAVNGKAYIFGGFRSASAPYNHAYTYEYDPVANTYTQKGDLSLGRAYLDVAVVDGLIYGFGGDTYDGANLFATTRTEVFDPAAGTWDDAAVADLPTASGEGRAFGFDTASAYELAGKIVIAGGGQWPGDWNEVEMYDIASDSYDYGFPNLNVQRRNHAGFFVPGEPGKMFVFGGRSGAVGYGGDNPPYAPPEYYDVAFAAEPEPDIAVEPGALSATLAPDATTTVELTIHNNGDAPLDWSLNEAEGVLNVKVTPNVKIPVTRDVQLSLDAVQNTNPQTAAWQPTGPVSLVLDDGSAENSIGIGGTWEFIFLNRFTPNPADFPFVLDTVSVYFPSFGLVEVGDNMTLVLYENTSGNVNPALGSNFLAAFPVTVQALDVFNNYTLSTPITFNGPGDVLVGVIDMEVPGSSYWPAAMDTTATQARSWAGWWSISPPPVPPTLPPDDTWGLIDNFGFPGNWMIRASGNTVVDIPWLSETPTSGTVPAGGSVVVEVTFDSTGLGVGQYLASLVINSNDPDTAKVTVPVTMNVSFFNFYLPLVLRAQ
jgi:hypothetical protein